MRQLHSEAGMPGTVERRANSEEWHHHDFSETVSQMGRDWSRNMPEILTSPTVCQCGGEPRVQIKSLYGAPSERVSWLVCVVVQGGFRGEPHEGNED